MFYFIVFFSANFTLDSMKYLCKMLVIEILSYNSKVDLLSLKIILLKKSIILHFDDCMFKWYEYVHSFD